MVFSRRKEIALTEGRCKDLNRLLLAIEVLFGKRAYLKRFDFDSKIGQLQVGEEIVGIAVVWFLKDKFNFYLNEKMEGDCFVARFDGNSGEVKVIKTSGPASGEKSMWIVGRSAEARWEEPLFD